MNKKMMFLIVIVCGVALSGTQVRAMEFPGHGDVGVCGKDQIDDNLDEKKDSPFEMMREGILEGNLGMVRIGYLFSKSGAVAPPFTNWNLILNIVLKQNRLTLAKNFFDIFREEKKFWRGFVECLRDDVLRFRWRMSKSF